MTGVWQNDYRHSVCEIVQNQSEPESGTEIEIVAGSKAALEANHYVVGPAFITGANARSRFGLFV